MASTDSASTATYRFDAPTHFAAAGALMLVALSAGAWSLARSNPPTAPMGWIAVAIAAVLFLHALAQRRARCASQSLTLDDSGISGVDDGRYTTLRWELIGSVRTLRGELELADSNRFVVVRLSRQLDDYSGAVKSALTHLESAYDKRSSGARSRPSTTTLTLPLSIRPQIFQTLGSFSVLAVSAWAFMNLRVLPAAITVASIALWNLARAAHTVTVGPIIKVRTLIRTHEIPIESVQAVTLEAHSYSTPTVVIRDVNGFSLVVALPNLPGRQLELYDRIRRLTDARSAVSETSGMTTRIVPIQAALFAGSAVVAAALIGGGSVLTGEMLRFSAQLGLVGMARTALALGSPIEAGGLQRITPLRLAARAGHASTVDLLLAMGADPVKPSGDAGFTPLHAAAEYGRTDVVRILLKAGVNPDVRNDWKQTPLWQVSWQKGARMVDIARVLLDAGATIDAPDKDGWTPLHMTVRADNHALLTYLIRRGANVGMRTHKGNTAMSLAIAENRVDTLRAMIAAGAELNAPDGHGRTPLARAVALQTPQPFVDILLEAGARTDIRDQGDYTPLQNSVWSGQSALVESLLRHGADPNAAMNPVDLPLMLAIQRGHTDIARALLGAGAKWDLEADGWTAIQRAAKAGNVDIVTALIDRGANPLASSSMASPPLHIAAHYGQLAVVSMLVERGVDVNQRWRDWSPLRVARTSRNTPVAFYLLNHGAH